MERRKLSRMMLAAAAALVLAVPAGVPAAGDLEIQASVDRRRVRVGETFMLNVDVIGTQKARRPRLQNADHFDVSYLGSTQKFSMINGRVSSQSGHRFMLTARKPGRYELGPFEVPYDGRTHKGGSATVEVVAGSVGKRSGPATGPPKGPDLTLELQPAKSEFWVGEKVPLRLLFSAGEIDVDGLDYPRLPAQGITLDPFVEPARRTARVAGTARRFLDFGTSMIAVRPGTFQLGPASIEVTVAEADPRNRGRPFGGFSLGLRQRRKVVVESDPVEITVRPLPADGRPDDFSGAVGTFEFDVEVGPGAIAAGDPVTVRTLISGDGNLSGVQPPAYAEGDALRAYDPLPAPREDQPETLVTEQIVIPRRDGEVELPPLVFGYFDPELGQYRTIVRGPFPIDVAAAEPSRQGAVFARRDDGLEVRTSREPLGRDIVYIKVRPGRPATAPTLVLRPAFAMGMTLPVLAYLGVVLYVRRRDRLASDPRIARYRAAGREVRRRLVELGKTDGVDRFQDELTAAVAEYLCAKLDLPPGAIDRDRVLGALREAGVDEAAREAAARYFERAEQVRYAGAAAVADRESVLAPARALVDALEGERSLAARIGVAGMLAALVPALVLAVSLAGAAGGAEGVSPLAADAGVVEALGESGVVSAAASDPIALFFEGNAAYHDGAYARAIDGYERAIAAGGASGSLYFNLANAYFKQGELGRALLNYERARRLLPRDPDVDANRDYARDTAGSPPTPTPMWARVAFPLARAATADELATLTLAAWWVLVGLLIVRTLAGSLRRGLGQAGWVVALLVVFVSINLGYRLAAVELADTAIVVAPGGVVARYEPSVTGAEYFDVGEGEVLAVADRRDGWVKLRRDDGVRGWVSADRVADL